MNNAKKDEFSLIYDEHVPKIYRFIFLKVSSREIAEDISSEVFVRTWSEFNKQDIRNIQAFLYGVARNLIADHYRVQSKVKIVSVEATFDVQDEQDNLQERANVGSDMEMVRKALSDLNDDYQDLIIWRYLEELSIPEIAEITGKSEENVRVGIHRALKSLKGRLPVEGIEVKV